MNAETKKQVTIRKNEFDEYEVPTPTSDYPDSIYFTEYKEDAVDTAIAHYGTNIEIKFKRGTYQKEG